MARRHSIQYGAIRYFNAHYLDSRKLRAFDTRDRTPGIIFYLSEGKEDEDVFEKELIALETHEPKKARGIRAIFNPSYEWTRKYKQFQIEMVCNPNMMSGTVYTGDTLFG
jgi:hypothetical protein